MHQWICLNEFYKLMESFFFKFRIRFQIFGRKQNFFKRIERREYLSNYNALYINGFVSTNSTN